MSFFDPTAYVILPWSASGRSALPDHLRCTYELIVSLAYSRDRQRTPPVTRRQMAAWRGLAVRTIDDHLAALRERGLIRNDPGHAGACLVLELLRPADVPAAAKRPDDPPVAPPAEDAALAAEAPDYVKADDPLREETDPLPEENNPLQEPPVFRGPSRQIAQPAAAGLQPAAGIEEEYSPFQSLDREYLLLAETLLEAGVFHGVAQRVAGLPWVTLDLARRWVAVLKRQEGVRSLGAVLAKTLQNPKLCFPPPPLPAQQDVRTSRYAAEEPGPPLEAAPAPEVDFDWQALIVTLAESLDERSLTTWFGEAYALSFSESGLVIALASPLAVDYVGQRHMLTLHKAVAKVVGRDVPVRLAVARMRR